jgi:hypothetical protein
MASPHQLAIAKAALSAGLLRPDPSSVSRDEIEQFHALLDRAVTRCSPANVQVCSIQEKETKNNYKKLQKLEERGFSFF